MGMEGWFSQLTYDDRVLLLACTVLRQFDHLSFAALVDNPTEVANYMTVIKRLPCIEIIAGTPNECYQITPALVEPLLTHLRNEFAAQHRLFRQRAFGYFATQLETNATLTHDTAEASLMAQLDVLFFILADSNELDILDRYLLRVEVLSLQKRDHIAALRYYRAVWHRQEGRYEQAQQMIISLLDDVELTMILRARLFNALGIVYDYRGRYDDAIQAYGQSAHFYQSLNDPIGEGKARKNQGIVYHELAQYEKAQPLFARCHELAKQRGDRLLEARALVELGYTAKELGQWENAQQAYEQALAHAEALADRELIARLHNNLGSLHCFIGNWSIAEAYYQKALALIQEQRDTADILHNLGFLYFVQGRYDDAHAQFSSGLALAQTILDRDAISEFHYRLGSLAERQGDLSGAYNAYTEALATIEDLRREGSQEETRISVLGSRQHMYQSMVLLLLQLGRTDEALTAVEFAKSRAFLDRWGQVTNTKDDHSERVLSATEIQAQLAPDSALIEYFATGHLGPGEIMLERLPPATQRLRNYLSPPEQLLAFVVTNRSISVVMLDVNLRQIEAQYFYRGDNRLRGTRPAPGEQLRPLRRWQLLATQLIDPLRPYLTGKRHLYLVPHSTLHYLPLHALASADAPLATAQTTISYAPSATVLCKICLGNGVDRPKQSTCLAIGVDREGLSNAEAEAKWIAQQLKGEALVGSKATITQVLARLGEASVLHFACHGHFRRLQPMRSALMLSDGELTAVDLLQQALMQAKLVTLSACDTGLNQLAHGDELMGLTRAFLMQGAQTLVVSLWQVHDIATRLFMERFYESWVSGATRAAALLAAQHHLRTLDWNYVQQRLASDDWDEPITQAQRQLLKTMMPGDRPFDHPYYWGAFLLIGNPD